MHRKEVTDGRFVVNEQNTICAYRRHHFLPMEHGRLTWPLAYLMQLLRPMRMRVANGSNFAARFTLFSRLTAGLAGAGIL